MREAYTIATHQSQPYSVPSFALPFHFSRDHHLEHELA